jgi:hypothetical protein
MGSSRKRAIEKLKNNHKSKKQMKPGIFHKLKPNKTAMTSD